ncbi:hypothetical protein LO744_12970 [Chryseobacterium sp. C-17]|uniref:Uncharacterized protein n=2 Tax=Chryseobacterium turcicum TaxID=2898076 RepID=A0A9Q3V3P1_9FLAO|nr:hypothetical protein [Chryseobacterium turcicum]
MMFYFIALLIMPCSDVKAQPVENSYSQVSLNTEDPHSDITDDGCSPFCFCSCCQITVTAFKMEPFSELPVQVKTYFSKKILFDRNNIAYQLYDHIWQPPKI